MKEQLKKSFPKAFTLLKKLWHRGRGLNPLISRHYLSIGAGRFLALKPPFGSTKLRPNLFVIGAEKSGTTSLHHYLDQHPEIFMSKPNKEPQYLLPLEITRRYFERAGIAVRSHHDVLKNHMLSGYSGQKIIGESTTSYTRGRNDSKHGIPEKIAALGEDVKCIYIIRHPIERLVSTYQHQVREGRNIASIEETIKTQSALIRTSLYAQHAELYLRHLHRDQLLLVLYEDFATAPQKVLKQIYAFLEVDEAFMADTSHKHNLTPDDASAQLSTATFQKLAKEFKQDQQKLEPLIGRQLPWDLNVNRWHQDAQTEKK